MKLEDRARDEINRQLTACGRQVQDHKKMDLGAAPAIAVRELPLDIGTHWRSFSYDELVKRDKLNCDIFWLKGKTLGDSEKPAGARSALSGSRR
ncbi:MAG TPA: hypothetical protein VE085_14055 [Burkholderiales bacterium]|nr:hypothetical protein [Burkholderiales bacterium]